MRWKELLTPWLVVALAMAASTPTALGGQAQGAAAAQHRNPRIPFDRNGASFTSVLPFDQRFSLVNAAPAPLLRVTTWYADSTTLPQAECSDLSARTRIRAAIQSEGEAKLGTLAEAARDSVTLALMKRHDAVPIEVFDSAAREQLGKAFADTLGTHPTTNRAALDALSAALDTRLDALPVRALSRARWTRTTRAALSDSFSLAIEKLGPNRDFTFCVESVEALSATDSASLAARLATTLGKELRGYFVRAQAGVELPDSVLRRLQQGLRAAALPMADSIVTSPGSLLAPAPPIRTVIAQLTSIANINSTRCQFASLFNTEAGTRPPPPANRKAEDSLALAAGDSARKVCGSPQFVRSSDVPLGWAVRELVGDLGLARLAHAAPLLRVPATEAARLAAAARVALTVGALSCKPANNLCGEAELIARGRTPLDRPGTPTRGITNIEGRTSSADLRPWADNLDSTLVRLGELRDLARHVAGDTAAVRILGLTAARLDSTRQKIDDARAAAMDQRTYIRIVMEQLDAMDAAVLGVAASAVGRDFERVGVATTSSASYETRARWHVGQDIGVLYAFRGGDTRETAPYLGVSIYLRPVNKRGELPWFCPLDLRCTSINLGVTTSKFEEEDRYAGVLDGLPLIVGVGTRIGDFLRLSYNLPLVYTYRFDEDGTAHRRLDHLNAVTLSLDADIREILGALGTSLFGK